MNKIKTHSETKAKVLTLPTSAWKEYKELRLAALKNEPQAFGSSYERESAYPDEEWQERLKEAAEGKRHIFFARLDEKLVGMVAGGRDYEESNSNVAYIWGLYIDASLRRKGIAKLLMSKVLEELSKDRGIQTIRLEANVEQESAVKLYESLGFKKTQAFLRRMGNGLEHQEIEMQKRLK
jgi:ribosomal protein S18 acetylase RimI-like enzyme